MRKIENNELGRVTAEEFSQMRKTPVVVVLENVRSALNVGAFFRTCDAFAIEKIILCGFTPTPPSKEIRKSALGADQTVAWESMPSAKEALEALKAEGYLSFAIEQVDGSHSLEGFAVEDDKKYALIFGNEVEGVQQDTVNMCDGAIEIPQGGTKHSLNVSVAGGVVLWHFFRGLLLGK